MSGVLQYLAPGGGNIIILQLPESTNFFRSGDPAIIRAADYQQSRAQRNIIPRNTAVRNEIPRGPAE